MFSILWYLGIIIENVIFYCHRRDSHDCYSQEGDKKVGLKCSCIVSLGSYNMNVCAFLCFA